MLENGFIKLHRSLLKWEWYDDQNTFKVFIHLLLTVNIEENKWHGENVPRGARVTSYKKLYSELKLSEKSVRTALKHLERTGEVAVKKTNKYSIITVINYNKFQERAGKRAGNGQATGTQWAGNGHSMGNSIRKNKESNKKEKEYSAAPNSPMGDSSLAEIQKLKAEARR